MVAAAAARSFAAVHAVHALAVVVPIGLITGVLCYDRFMAAVRADQRSLPGDRRLASRELAVLAVLWIAAGAVHLGVMDEHFGESAVLGVFFLVLAVLQIAYAIRLLMAPSRMLVIVGLAANLAVVLLWAWTRSVSVPFDLGGREKVGLADGLAVLIELAAAATAVLLIRIGGLRRVAVTRGLLITGLVVAAGAGTIAAVAVG